MLACGSSHLRAGHSNRLGTMHCASVQCVEQLGSLCEGLSRLRIAEPMPRPLVHFRPRGFLFLDGGFEEMVRSFWGLGGELVGFSFFGDKTEVVVDFAYYAGLFPGFAFGGILCGGFIRLPSAFGKHPSAPARGLDEQDVVLVGGERDHSGN